ncbi:hypothetical protein [Ahniella affigens]|uniref:hypothetical protein n=1 Tax=Ahniella affigens TaxID=2021234 RepID=UPI0011B1D6A7|nr:hypothetical protein [Ahniella affigens]
MNWKRMFGKQRKTPPDQTENIFRRHFDGDFIAFPLAERLATLSDVEEVEARAGMNLPPALVAHLVGRFPGVHVEVKENIWRRPKALDVGPFWTFLYGFHTYTPVEESEDWMRLDRAAEQFLVDTEITAVPILRVVGDADVYCACANGSIARYRHETNELERVEGDFWHVLDLEAAALAERKMRMSSRVGS